MPNKISARAAALAATEAAALVAVGASIADLSVGFGVDGAVAEVIAAGRTFAHDGASLARSGPAFWTALDAAGFTPGNMAGKGNRRSEAVQVALCCIASASGDMLLPDQVAYALAGGSTKPVAFFDVASHGEGVSWRGNASSAEQAKCPQKKPAAAAEAAAESSRPRTPPTPYTPLAGVVGTLYSITNPAKRILFCNPDANNVVAAPPP